MIVKTFAGSLILGLSHVFAVTTIPGDLNDDFDTTVADIALLVSHIQGTQFLEPAAIPYVDFDQNGILDSVDVEVLVELVMESQGPQVIPMAAIKETLPQRGESNVGVKRETILYFTLPLAEDAVISNDNFFALFGGEKLLTRIEVSSDRLKATLFYLDPLPDNSRVRVIFDGAGIKDILGRDFDPDQDGEAGGLYGLDFNTVSITELPGTAISGTVYQSRKNDLDNDVPLAGVVIEVVGAEETIRTTTAGDGSFTLDPCPGGRFFVNVDGRPVTGQFPTGNYYPFVGKAWYAQPGRTDNLVNEDGKIYLPLITAGSLKSVSQTEITVVEFPQAVLDDNPALSGVRVTVPANSLFNEEGSRGGMVGIAPVAPDRIPEPLPEGLNLPLVITVQTDGPANFDRPAPVVFPNLPDPDTGLPLPPGSKSALWSFNHDSGLWEIAGPMTVSSDGLWVTSDPGVGIRQPGWHGTDPGTRNSGGGGGGGPGGPDGPDPDDDCQDPGGCEEPDPDPDDDDDDSDEKDCKTEGALALSGFVQSGISTALLVPKSLPFGVGQGITTVANGVGAEVDSLIAPERSGEFWQGAAQNTAISGLSLLAPPSPDPASRIAGIALSLPGVLDSWASTGDRLGAAAGCLAPLPLSNPTDGRIQVFSEQPQIIQTLSFDPDVFPKLSLYTRYLEIQYDVIEGSYNFSRAFYKDETWLYADSAPYLKFIFEQLVDDFQIGETEKNLILNSALRPSPITDLQVTNLIDLFNDRSSNGISEPDRLALLSAATQMKDGLEAIKDETPYDDPYFFWNYYLADLWKELYPPPPDPPIIYSKSSSGDGSGGGGGEGGGGPRAYVNGSLIPEPGEHYYKLVSLNDQFTLRGQTNKLGQIDNMILPPDSAFQITYYKPDTNKAALSIFRTPSAGNSNRIPVSRFFEIDDSEADTDGDQVPDIAEDIVGTDPENGDSDGDGVLDGAELVQDGNPLDGTPVATGLLASIPIEGALNGEQGELKHLIARDDLLIGSTDKAVLLFDISSELEPILIGSYHGEGSITDIALQGDLVAIATGTPVLAFIDIRDPSAPIQFRRELLPNEKTLSVSMDGNLAFVGLESQFVATIDSLSGFKFSSEASLGIPGKIAFNSQYVYAIVNGGISTFSRSYGAYLNRVNKYTDSQISWDVTKTDRLFLGNGILYCTTDTGYLSMDLTDPASPSLISSYDLGQFGWREIRSNGSGLMLAATSANSTDDGEHNVDVYNVGSTGFESNYIQTIQTPDVTKSIALHNGILYAGGTRLNVINYLAPDNGTTPPSITISSDQGPTLSEGTYANISALAQDDVQVRNVEFYVDGVLDSTDGNYPFTNSFRVPTLSQGANTVTVSAIAFDTAGNSANSGDLVLSIIEDTTPPVILNGIPSDQGILTNSNKVGFVSTKIMDPASLGSTAFFIVNAGPDLALGSDDDFILDPGNVEVSTTNTVVYMRYNQELDAGKYQLNVTTDATDLAGIPLAEPFQSTFLIFAQGEGDTDGDGLPDELEASVAGYSAFQVDSDGDGIPDGDEDLDGDGINNITEHQILGTDWNDSDTDNDNLSDKDEVNLFGTDPTNNDTDQDGLRDGIEVNDGLNPLNPDTDGDLLDDGTEDRNNYDPKTPDTTLEHAVSAPVIIYYKAGDSEAENLGAVSKPVAHENQ